MRTLFLPGYGASGRLYATGLGPGWRALDPPPFHETRGAFLAYERWLTAEVDRSAEPAWLAGHSMGGALAILAAVARPAAIARLTLISPAGLPLRKPITASIAEFVRQTARGRYDMREVVDGLSDALRAPRAALRLARSVRSLDLGPQMRKLRRLGIPTEVVGCTSDTLVTPDHCVTAARLLGASYREVQLPGGHMWMLEAWPQLAELL